MSSGPKAVENRGGKRKGSGRKRAFTITEQQAKAMLRKAKKFAKLHGKTVDDVLLAIIHDQEEDPKTIISAIKVFKEFTMGKTSEQNVNINDNRGPTIWLPEMRPDPAKLIPEKIAEA